MSVLAIKGVPAIWDLRRLVLNLVRIIRGHFEGLNFEHQKGEETKTAYVRLAKGLKTKNIIQKINKTKFKFAKKQFFFKATVTNHIPDLPFVNPQTVPRRAQKHFKIPLIKGLDEIVVDTLIELLTELQSKYTELYKLSDSTQHRLLNEIAQIIFNRLKNIAVSGDRESFASGFAFSKAYRRLHPHFTDFPLILSTLHRIEDADGLPRTQLLEHELIVVPKTLCVGGDIPIEKLNETCNKCSEKIISRVNEHIEELNSEVKIQPCNEDEEASKRVKEEIIKISSYIEMIIRQVVSGKFVNSAFRSSEYVKMRIIRQMEKGKFLNSAFRSSECVKMRMYGEPYIPLKNVRAPMMRKHGAGRVERSDLCNLLLFNIPKHKYASLVALDGTVLDNAKLVIRLAETKKFKPHISNINGMRRTIQKLTQNNKSVSKKN